MIDFILKSLPTLIGAVVLGFLIADSLQVNRRVRRLIDFVDDISKAFPRVEHRLDYDEKNLHYVKMRLNKVEAYEWEARGRIDVLEKQAQPEPAATRIRRARRIRPPRP